MNEVTSEGEVMNVSAQVVSERDDGENGEGTRLRRKWWVWFGVLVVGVGLALVWAFRRVDRGVEVEQESAIAGLLDGADPGWRLAEIDAARPAVEDSVNSAICIRAVAGRLGSPWPDAKLDGIDWNVEPPELLDDRRMALLEGELTRLAAVRKLARPLADMPTGRNEFVYLANPNEMHMTDQSNAELVGKLLQMEMAYLSNKGEVTEAVRSGRSWICVGRSMKDEPFLISTQSSLNLIFGALNGIEQVLSLGEAQEQELVSLGKLLAEEAKHNTLMVSARGTRAFAYSFYRNFTLNKIPIESIPEEDFGRDESVEGWLSSPRSKIVRQEAMMFELLNRAVEIARRPSQEQTGLLSLLDHDCRNRRGMAPTATDWAGNVIKMGDMANRKSAQVATMRVMVAAERHRMRHGRFPEKVEALVPGYLSVVPRDPYDGKPVRMVRFADGVTVYSVGKDGVDNGGLISRDRNQPDGTDVGFRLWDPAARRKPARPLEAEQQDP